MTRHFTFLPAMLLSFATACSVGEARVRPGDPQIRTAFQGALPALDGAHLRTTLVEVRYDPGGSSQPHRHPCPVVGYVVEGNLRTQVGDGPVRVYRAGETFYEPPNTVHRVSANASDERPVRLLATLVCDREVPLSAPER